MCFDNGVESEKSLALLKDKWRALLDKYKSVSDNNNPTGREWKTFKPYEDIDELMASSDKVNPTFVKETKAHKTRLIPTIFYRPEIKKAVRNQRNGRSALLKATVRMPRKLEKLGKGGKRIKNEEEKA